MKKLIFILTFLMAGIATFGQSERVMESDLKIKTTTPRLYLQGLGGTILIQGTTSGTLTLRPYAATSGTIVFPSSATEDTLATQTYSRAHGGGSMVYPGAGISLSTGSAWGTSITNSSANWNTAYTDRLKWNGGSDDLVAVTGRTSLGGTTVGQSFFILTNPSTITFPRINADNSVTALSAANFRTATATVGTADTAGMLTNYMLSSEARAMVQDSIQRNALFNSDYYITEVSGTVYAIPHPKSSYTNKADTNLTPVLQHCLDQITTGGKIYIAAGTYDHMDEVIVKYNNTTIEGAGMDKTKLIAVDSIDHGQTMGLTYGFIQVRNQDYFTIKNLYVDGNGDNQEYIDDNNNAVMVGRSHGIVISPDYVTTNDTAMYPVIENCYIKSFAGAAGIVMRAKYGRISNCVIDDNFSNGITLYGRKSIVERNYVKGSADVGITNFGLDNTIAYNIIENINGTKGTTGSFWGIGIEGQNSYNGHRNRIIGNIILGDVDWPIVNFSYSTTYSHVGNVIDGNIINVSPATNVIGIYCWQDSLSIVRNNFVRFTAAGTGAVGIKLLGAARNIVENNQIVMNAGNVGIELTYNGSNYSLYNLIRNNNIQNSGYYGVYVQANCDYNRIQNNIVSGASSDLLISATATSNTIWNNNYGVTSGSWLQETGAKNLTYTANADSTNAASKIKLGSQNITVTSASANNVITLPEASAATIGSKITGIVGANGFELRVATSQYSTVYLNNVKNTSTTGVEAAIPADTSFEVICLDATHWILKAWTNLGAVVAAIVPDAITKH